MAKSDGEYELVLGNRQLLSAFFVVVILFALFFTMGYIVGRNSAPSAMASLTPPGPASGSRPPATVPVSTPPPAPAPEPNREAENEPPKKSEPPPAEEEKRPAPKARVVTPAVEKRAPSTEAPPAPGPGQMYLQVSAVAQPQAGAVVETLKQKGFPARLGDSPNGTIFRVLVGPFADAASLGKAKADLENAGFHPIVRK
jgi:cell division protein FtsN